MDGEALQMMLVLPGDQIRVRLAGRRPFTTTVTRVRDDGSLDVRDPRNGGTRTITLRDVASTRTGG